MSAPAEVAYVTAYALGLAFSGHRGDDAVVELLTAADGCPETLNAARAALPANPCHSPSTVLAADELLMSAEGAARLIAPAAG